MNVGEVVCEDQFAPSHDPRRQILTAVRGVTVVPMFYASSQQYRVMYVLMRTNGIEESGRPEFVLLLVHLYKERGDSYE